MSQSKDLFIMLREQEIYSKDTLPSKKEIEKNVKEFITTKLEDGYVNPQEALSQIVRLKASIETIEKELKNNIGDQSFEAHGLNAKWVNGYDKPNYEDDLIYTDLKRQLKEREDLLQLALKSKSDIFDSYGELVPKVSTTPTKGSLKVTF